MTLRDIFRFKELTLIEVITLGAISIVLALIILPEKDVPIVATDIASTEQFDEYPLIAWKDTDKKGDIVKIKYRVRNTETYIKVYDITGRVVHKQPFRRSPWDDGTPRDFTYNWMLYYTQDYGDDIPPGEYEIRVCHKYDRNVDLSTTITI
jgi:hypothetical protein